MSYNLPGPDKLPNPAQRLNRAVELIKSASPTVLCIQEAIGVSEDGGPSGFAQDIDRALGSGWTCQRPTTAWNENYIWFREDAYELVRQYSDVILRADSGGRHITRIVLRDKATGLVLAVGNTHLVNGGANETDRQDQSKQAMYAMKIVARQHDDCPIIICGDMNTVGLLSGFLDGGLVALHRTADTKKGVGYETYAKISDLTPNKGEPIDQIYISRSLDAPTYETVLGLGSSGHWQEPRPSDHVPVTGTVRIAP